MYLWIKALHVVAVISWMAGLLYLPRLFVYHSLVGPGAQSDTFKTMERKLLFYIMVPAMVVTWIAGLSLMFLGDWRAAPWLHAKLALVVILTGAHFYFGVVYRAFARGENRHSARFFKIFNELSTVLMIGIVILVVVKPF